MKVAPPVKNLTIFTIIFASLASTTLIKIDCPICGGTGYVYNIPGIENLQILDVSYEEEVVIDYPCELYFMYSYVVNTTVRNDGSDPVTGIVVFIVEDPEKNVTVVARPALIEVPANVERYEFSDKLTFHVSYGKIPSSIDISVYIPKEKSECPVCEGRGKVPMNSWILSSSLKGLRTTEKPPEPPPYVMPREEEME